MIEMKHVCIRNLRPSMPPNRCRIQTDLVLQTVSKAERSDNTDLETGETMLYNLRRQTSNSRRRHTGPI